MGWGAFTTMMAAMMLPAAIPSVYCAVRRAGIRSMPVFVGSYFAVWVIASSVIYALNRPHGAAAAAAVVIAAGVYELTPLKRHFRRRCREPIGSGAELGLCCVGSCLGLMLVPVAVDLMNVTWMVAAAVVVAIQKLVPAKAAVDVPLAVAIVGLGVLIGAAPAAVPGFMPDM